MVCKDKSVLAHKDKWERNNKEILKNSQKCCGGRKVNGKMERIKLWHYRVE